MDTRLSKTQIAVVVVGVTRLALLVVTPVLVVMSFVHPIAFLGLQTREGRQRPK